MKKKIGMIGLGDIAQKAYLPVLAHHELVDIVGIMSTTMSTVERIGDQYHIERRFTEVDELLRLDLDAVFVHSPTETHGKIVMECLSRGIHVYVDKPLSYDISESEQMAEIAYKRGKHLCVGFNRRFAPRYIEAKDWLEEVGGFDVCTAQKHRIKQQKHSAKHTLYDDFIHMIDLLVWLGAGEYDIASFMQRTDEEGKLLHASGCLSLGKAIGFISMDRSAGVDLEKLELHGGGRSVEVVNLETASFYDRGNPIGQGTAIVKPFGSWDSTLYRRGFAGIIRHFLETMDSPEKCTIRADQVLATHHLVEKLAKSSLS